MHHDIIKTYISKPGVTVGNGTTCLCDHHVCNGHPWDHIFNIQQNGINGINNDIMSTDGMKNGDGPTPEVTTNLVTGTDQGNAVDANGLSVRCFQLCGFFTFLIYLDSMVVN